MFQLLEWGKEAHDMTQDKRDGELEHPEIIKAHLEIIIAPSEGSTRVMKIDKITIDQSMTKVLHKVRRPGKTT